MIQSSIASEMENELGTETLYQPFECKVELVRDLTPTEKLFRLQRTDGQSFGHMPGQFVQVSVYGIGEAPISVSSSPTRGDYLELGIRKAGKLTSVMHHQLKEGNTIGLRGPFGTYFDTENMKGKDLILISGGCGLAPMRALIQYVEDTRDQYGKVTVLYGAKSPDDVLYQDELLQWVQADSMTCQFTVDAVTGGTCWDGNVGLITTLIPPLEINPKNIVAVIVGPPIMYKFVIKELNAKGVSNDNIIVSLERHMKCGVGK